MHLGNNMDMYCKTRSSSASSATHLGGYMRRISKHVLVPATSSEARAEGLHSFVVG